MEDFDHFESDYGFEESGFTPDFDSMYDGKDAMRTQSLFLETSYGDQEFVQYTLKPRDHKTKDGRSIPSIKRLYLEAEDPTEYNFAYKYFLDWNHWQKIKGNQLIAKHMEGWKDELDVRMAAIGITSMIDMATDAHKPSFQASKFLAHREWDKNKPGRPSKEAVAREAKIAAKINEEFGGDLARLRR